MTGVEPAVSTLTVPPGLTPLPGGALPLCYITVAPVQGFEPRPVVINSHVPYELGDTGSKERDVSGNVRHRAEPHGESNPVPGGENPGS